MGLLGPLATLFQLLLLLFQVPLGAFMLQVADEGLGTHGLPALGAAGAWQEVRGGEIGLRGLALLGIHLHAHAIMLRPMATCDGVDAATCRRGDLIYVTFIFTLFRFLGLVGHGILIM